MGREVDAAEGPAAAQDQNRFLRSLTATERRAEKRMIEVARATFATQRERSGSIYHCASGLTPDETNARIVEELTRVMTLLALEAKGPGELAPEDLPLIHRGVFEPVFGGATLDPRGIDDPNVTYPVWELDHAGKTVMRTQLGQASKQISRALEKALSRLDADVTALAERAKTTQVPLREAVLPAAQIYAQIIAVHPWHDGNGRTAWLVMNHTLIRCGVLAVATYPSRESRVVLGKAVVRSSKRDVQPLADLLAAAIQASEAHA